MPHLVLEYTDNIKSDARIRELLEKSAAVLRAQGGVFPLGGIRCRAIGSSSEAISSVVGREAMSARYFASA